MSRLYAGKLRDNPPSPDKPWRVVLGCDEYTPGSKVVSANRRKNMALVFNFVELGPDILECDASWYIPVIVRAQVFKKLPGGWSAMLRAIMRQLLVGLGSFSCAGVLVPIEVNPGLRVAYQLTAALQTALTDGEGIMKCLQWNGHGSMRPLMHRAGLHLALRPMGALVALYIARQSAALPLSTLHCHNAVEKMLSRVTSPSSAALPLST